MSITPISTHNADLTYQTKVKNEAESLLKLFKHFLNDPQQLFSCSLVNKFWRHIALHPHLWQKICYLTGVEIPLNQDRSYEASYNAFCYEKSAFFLNQVRNCTEPKIEARDITVDLSKYSVNFVQDRFLTMRKKAMSLFITLRIRKL